jgi:hypothetical protein
MLLVSWNYAEGFVIPTICLRNKAEIINIRDKNIIRTMATVSITNCYVTYTVKELRNNPLFLVFH